MVSIRGSINGSPFGAYAINGGGAWIETGGLSLAAGIARTNARRRLKAVGRATIDAVGAFAPVRRRRGAGYAISTLSGRMRLSGRFSLTASSRSAAETSSIARRRVILVGKGRVAVLLRGNARIRYSARGIALSRATAGLLLRHLSFAPTETDRILFARLELRVFVAPLAKNYGAPRAVPMTSAGIENRRMRV